MDKKIEAKKQIKKLVGRFEGNIAQYKKADYDEANTRTDFIDPFFENLGWDVANKQGYAEQYREVVREAMVIIAGKQKAPDYSFRIGGRRKFFVEAKKPAVDLKHQVSSAYQLRRYAYTAKLPLSILTDFDEFSVYDTRIKPTPRDSASWARIFYCTYKDYLKNFDFIYETFSKEGILKGSFDRYVESTRNKRGTSEVDKEFLKLIDRWRENLAKNVALRNKRLSLYELNFAIQKIIDRIIFLRIAEDRQIEDYGKLQNLLNGTNTYKRLLEICFHSDKKYNSGLFDFDKDEITPELTVDDKILKEILKSVYYPESPYEFSVLDVEILGNIYEQFLGKTIRLTPAHLVKVEEKPEVKKAGGIYYTPKYIVDYIVKNTVGEVIKGKTPKQIEKIKILDPACGSGSFLLGAYQCLLNYHLDWYSKDKNCKKALKKGQIIQTGKDSFQLTIAEKQRILLNSIFGVDIDTQAVEVSKLSLLLKLLEGETEESTRQLFRYTQLKLLPDLSNNIKCGNSLIGPDFYDTQQTTLFDETEMRRINVFDWKSAFPDIFQNGGFDVVIGNPPYGFHKIHTKQIKQYFKENFVASQGSFEHYFLFIEKSVRILKKNGVLGFITPVTWLTIPSARALRKFVLENYRINEICWLPELVFLKAKVNTLISIIQKLPPKEVLVKVYNSLGFKKPPMEERLYKQLHFIESDYFIGIFEKEADHKILQKIEKLSKPLKEIARPCSGYNPYEVGKGIAPEGGLQTEDTVKTKPYHSEKKLSSEWKPEIIGRDLRRYSLNITGNRWIKYGSWLAAPRDPNNFIGKRILVQEITGGKEKRIIATYYNKELYHSRDVIPIKIEKELPHPFYLLGIINSKLITWYHHKRNPKAQKGLFPKVLVSDLKKLPIRTIDFSNPSEKAMHDKLVTLVDKMLELQKKFYSVRLESDKKMYKIRIDALDNQIDSLVYKLYGLTDKEIKIVEGG